jgi:hypothetical protein
MNGFQGRQSQVRTAAASLTFYLRARHSRDAFDHHHEAHFAAVPTSQPADSPTVNAVTQGDGRTQTEIARLHSQLLHWARWCGGQNRGLGRDIDGKVLGAHPDVHAGVMAGDWCFNLPWSGKGKNLLGHVMTHPSATSKGWHVQWETDPPGKESEPRSLGCIRGGNEADEANRQSRPWDGERVTGPQRK